MHTPRAHREPAAAAFWRPARAVLDLALPQRCAGCGHMGPALCTVCRDELAALAHRTAYAVTPSPCPDGFPPTWSQAPYDGTLAALLRAYKDDGRTDVAPVLAALLRGALAGPLAADRLVRAAAVRQRLLVVPVPTSRRARRVRGRDPLADLVTRALRGSIPSGTALRVRRKVADQAGLGAAARAQNLHESMGTARGAPARGHLYLLVDDIVTTGSTLAEAARVLRLAGATGVVAVTVAATRRRRPA